jgi:hypothetical protein
MLSWDPDFWRRRGFLELAMRLRIRALEDFKAFYKTTPSDSTAVTGIQTGVRLEGLRQSNHPRPIRRPLGHGTPVENHPTVG